MAHGALSEGARANTATMVGPQLLHIHVPLGYRTVSDVDAMSARIVAARSTAASGMQVVIAADWRHCEVFSPEVAAAIPAMFRCISNIRRSAIIHREDHATSVMQILRLIREANHPERRVFTDAAQMREFLAEVLSDPERLQLRRLFP